MQYRLQDGDIQIPSDWQDETMYIFRAPETEGYNIVINRTPIPHGVDPMDHLKSQLVIIKENLNEYIETAKEPVTVDDQEYRLISYHWKSPEGPVYQMNLMIVIGQTLMSMTATSAQEITDSQKTLLQKIMTSFVVVKASEG